MAWIERYGGTAFKTQTGHWLPYSAPTRRIHTKTVVALVGRGLLEWKQYSLFRRPNGYRKLPVVCGLKGQKVQSINLVACVVNPDHIIGVK
jgi:hypothetical protein